MIEVSIFFVFMLTKKPISMKKIFMFLMLAAASFSFKNANAQAQKERIQSAYILAFGRTPNSGEVTYWSGQGNLTINQIIERHKGYLKTDAGTNRAVIVKSYLDALGVVPTEAEIKYHTPFYRTYTESMTNHMVYLKQQPSELEKVIKRSYRSVFNREPSAGEITYWKQFGPIPYHILCGFHQDFKAKTTPPSVNGTLAVNPARVDGVIVSKSVLEEARTAATTLNNNTPGATVIAPGGANMVAAGGGNMVAAGGGNMVAAGGGNMVAAGGGN